MAPLIQLRGNALAWVTTLSCSFAMLLFGYDQGVMSGLIGSENFKMRIFGTLSPSSSISGLVVAIYEIGAFVGAISVMIFGERLGRRWSTALGQVITIVGAVLQATSFGLGQMLAARVITGIGVGIITATVPVWNAEISPSSTRGTTQGVLTLFAVLGLVIAYWTDYGASFHKSAFSYRFPLSFQLVFCVFQLSTIPFLPESPRWLMSRGRNDEAARVILAVCAADTLSESVEAATMYANIQFAVEIEEDGKAAWRDIFTMGPFRYFQRIMLAFGVQAMQQLTGINVIAYYSTVIFEQSVGMSPHLALLMGGFVSLAFMAGACIAIPLIDRVGRRKLLIYGFACASIGMAVAAIGSSKNTFTYGCVATFGIFFFNFNFGIGLQIPPWLYGVEVTPLKLRYFAGAIAAASGWIWNYAVVQVTQPGIENIGYKFFIVWAVLCFTWVWVVYFFYPETARKSLEELDFIFMDPDSRPVPAQSGLDAEKSPQETIEHVGGV